jgi:hypothetical protein
MQIVKPNWAAEAKFPIAVRIPVVIAIATGLPRDVVISKSTETLPQLLITWLASDHRYRRWLKAQPATQEPDLSTATVEQPTPVIGDGEPAEAGDKPKKHAKHVQE